MKTIEVLNRPDLLAKRILKLYNTCEQEAYEVGNVWYFHAKHICNYMANKFNVPVSKVCGVVAALSPATNWVQNIADAHNLLYAWVNNLDPMGVVVTTYGNNKVKAVEILGMKGHDPENIATKLLGSSKVVNKTSSFFWNILKPEDFDHVTIDRHAFRVALNSRSADSIPMTEKRYRNVSEAYRIVAKQVGGVTPSQVQAVCWLEYRNRYDHTIPAKISKLDPEIEKQIVS